MKKYKTIADKQEIKFYINDKMKNIMNNVKVEIIGRSMEVKNLQNNTFGNLLETEELLKEKAKKEIDKHKTKEKYLSKK